MCRSWGIQAGLREFGVHENRDVVLDIAWIGNESEIRQTVSESIRRGAELLIPVGTSASTVVKRHRTAVLLSNPS